MKRKQIEILASKFRKGLENYTPDNSVECRCGCPKPHDDKTHCPDCQPSVECKEIPNFSGYFANKLGELFTSKHRSIGKRNTYIKGELVKMKTPIEKSGYYYVSLWNDGKPSRIRVHQLIALTFIPNPDKKPYVCHKDGNPCNNNISNLYWGTARENLDDARKQGTWWGTRPNPKKTPPDLCHCHTDCSLPPKEWTYACKSYLSSCIHCQPDKKEHHCTGDNRPFCERHMKQDWCFEGHGGGRIEPTFHYGACMKGCGHEPPQTDKVTWHYYSGGIIFYTDGTKKEKQSVHLCCQPNIVGKEYYHFATNDKLYINGKEVEGKEYWIKGEKPIRPGFDEFVTGNQSKLSKTTDWEERFDKLVSNMRSGTDINVFKHFIVEELAEARQQGWEDREHLYKAEPQTDKTTWEEEFDKKFTRDNADRIFPEIKSLIREELKRVSKEDYWKGYERGQAQALDVYRGKLIKRVENEYSLKVYDEKDEKFTEGYKIGYDEGILTERKFVLTLIKEEK